jgi:hypothetical protein
MCPLVGTVMRGLKVFGTCIGAAFVCAFVFVAMLHFSLPPSDAAYGMPISDWFSDPFVFGSAICWAIVFGILTFPFAYFAVRKRRLLTSALFAFGLAVTEILLVTPFAGWRGLAGCVPALIVGLVVCRFSGWKWFAENPIPPLPKPLE